MSRFEKRIQDLVDRRNSLEAQIAVLGREWVAEECPYQEGQTVRIPNDVGSKDYGRSLLITKVAIALQPEEQRWYWIVGGRIKDDGRKTIGGFRIAIDRLGDRAKPEGFKLVG